LLRHQFFFFPHFEELVAFFSPKVPFPALKEFVFNQYPIPELLPFKTRQPLLLVLSDGDPLCFLFVGNGKRLFPDFTLAKSRSSGGVFSKPPLLPFLRSFCTQ